MSTIEEQFFFYDIPVSITKDPQLLHAHMPYLKALTSELAISNQSLSSGHGFVKASEQGFYEMLNNFHQIFTHKPLLITVYLDPRVSMGKTIKGYFTMVYAAGGLVSKQNQVLMIERLGKWDLPKGKVEIGEETEYAAVREVTEECGVKADINQKLCVTWHNYIHGETHFIKQTAWYKMDCIEDHRMCPQLSEDINNVAWLGGDQLRQALKNSYASIRYVLDVYANSLSTNN
jgi:ADP-ribose pyrophosphatase YjhB (NUDIX family)